MSNVVLQVDGLTEIYRMGEVDVHALRGVDLSLLEGELIVLLGASGSGKSRLLNIMGGIDLPTAGRVLYRGRDLTRASEAELTSYRRRHVGFVFQFYNLMPSLTARENVGLVTDIADDPLDPSEALALVGLADRMDHFPAQLSGGEQQRVAIARAALPPRSSPTTLPSRAWPIAWSRSPTGSSRARSSWCWRLLSSAASWSGASSRIWI